MRSRNYATFITIPLFSSRPYAFPPLYSCCILGGPGVERIVDVVPEGTELELQVKTGS